MGAVHKALGVDAFGEGWGGGLAVVDVANPVVDDAGEGGDASVGVVLLEVKAGGDGLFD